MKDEVEEEENSKIKLRPNTRTCKQDKLKHLV